MSKNMKSEKVDFAYCFRPIYYFTRVWGMMPFSFTRDSNGELRGSKITKRDMLWLIVSIPVYLSVGLLNNFNLKILEDVKATMILGDHIVLVVNLLFGIFMIIMDLWNRYKIVNILIMFIIFDKEVSKRLKCIYLCSELV